MATTPQLSQLAQSLLRVILDRKIVRGGELMRYIGISAPADFLAPAKELVDNNLVEVTGELTQADAPFATFGTKPSRIGYLSALVERR
jgi:hypothetical protein